MGDKTTRIYRRRGEVLELEREFHHGDVLATRVVFDAPGERLLTCGADGLGRIQRIDGKGSPIVLRGHESGLNGIMGSPDGRFVVTTSLDGTARLWRADTGEQLQVLDASDGIPNHASFTPDSRRVLVGSSNGTARFWFTDTVDLRRAAATRSSRELNDTERERFAELLGGR